MDETERVTGGRTIRCVTLNVISNGDNNNDTTKKMNEQQTPGTLDTRMNKIELVLGFEWTSFISFLLSAHYFFLDFLRLVMLVGW
jgi:hypothetical protein